MGEEILKTKGTGGSLQSDWTGSDFPVSEWSTDIIAEALLNSPIVDAITSGGMIKRANKKTFFMLSSGTTLTNLWATGVTSVLSSTYETPLDFNDTYIDPVESRTYTPVAWEVFDEIGAGVEAEVRKELAKHARWKIQHTCFSALDASAISAAFEFGSAGNALDYCNANSAVDWGDEFTIDIFDTGYEKILGQGYIPNKILLPPALYMDCFNQSQFTNAAQYGSQNSAILEGKVPRYMGVDFLLDTHMPNDNASKDVALMADFNYYMGLVVSKDGRIDYDNYLSTGQHHFYLTVKTGATVFREEAGVAFYT